MRVAKTEKPATGVVERPCDSRLAKRCATEATNPKNRCRVSGMQKHLILETEKHLVFETRFVVLEASL
jgi:hypothetical protein